MSRERSALIVILVSTIVMLFVESRFGTLPAAFFLLVIIAIGLWLFWWMGRK